MYVADALSSDLRYLLDLVQAGIDGIVSARTAAGVPPITVDPVWTPIAVGAVVGASTACLSRRGKSAQRAAVGGLAGSAIGMGCALAWGSRAFMGALARRAIGNINAVRDARWLAGNPIDYA